MFKNMKIEINSEQPLEEVVKELERLGYWISSKACDSNQAWCFEDSRVLLVEGKGTLHFSQCESTTLKQLKQMET